MVDAWSELREIIRIRSLAMVKPQLEWWQKVGAEVWGLDHGRSSQSRGRPSKFTAAAALAVVAELCRDGSLEAAAKSVGIGVSPCIDGSFGSAGAIPGSLPWPPPFRPQPRRGEPSFHSGSSARS